MKKKTGRPSKLENVDLKKVEQYAMFGLTQNDICILLDIHPSTICRHKKINDDFANALIKGQELAKASVTKSLFNLTRKGNLNAITFWLCNRHPAEWKHTQKIEHTGEVAFGIEFVEIKKKEEVINKGNEEKK